jgi:response regulator RpfG family c-di-GMP phosphodiesterase
MDIQMPLMNGYDAVRAIRKNQNQVPVIALTANTIKGENDKCLQSGMNDYIAKPFKEDVFLKIIAHWIKADVVINKTETPTQTINTVHKMYDLKMLEAVSNGNTAFIEKMTTLFCEQTPQIVDDMKTAFAKGDLEKMGALAHKIKPSIDNLNILQLKDTIRTIEKAGKENNNLPSLNILLQQTHDIINTVVNQIKTPAK